MLAAEIEAAMGADQVVLSTRSHTTRVSVEIRDIDALESAASELGWNFSREQTVRFYDGREVVGPSVRPPGWKYPIVVDSSTLAFDSYGGQWGNDADVARLKGAYTIHLARSLAENHGLDWEVVNG
ncbi:MAG: hypothetical protein ACYDAG_15610, partial [Chloroflexota bacterium]